MSAERQLLLPENMQIDLAITLYRQKAFGIHEDPNNYIELKSKRKTPHYLDIRPVISDGGMRRFVASTLLNLAVLNRNVSERSALFDIYDHLAGIPEAMTPFIPGMADRTNISLLQPSVNSGKVSDNKTPILGRYRRGETVAVFDNAVASGDTALDEIEIFKKAELDVLDYYVLLDRQEGGAPYVKEVSGIDITPTIGVVALVRILREEGEISVTQYDNVSEYLQKYGEVDSNGLIS